MDNVCTKCGEPWDISYQVEDEQLPKDEQEFVLLGSAIKACPCCKDTPNDDPDIQEYQEKGRGYEISMLAEILGDDIDGLASTLEDFGLV